MSLDHIESQGVENSFSEVLGVVKEGNASSVKWQGRNFKRIQDNAALLIGINYFDSDAYQLRGSIHDVRRMAKLLQTEFGFKASMIRSLTDDQKDNTKKPTKENILRHLSEVAQKATDEKLKHLWIYFSGHGSYAYNPVRKDKNFSKEAIVPVDYQTNGFITDEEIRRVFSKILPKDTYVTMVFDCSHSGTLADLEYVYQARKKVMKKTNRPEKIQASVVCLSACKNHEISGEVYSARGKRSWGGALTWALEKSIKEQNQNLSYVKLMNRVQRLLDRANVKQQAQLSSSKFMNPWGFLFKTWRGKKELQSF